MMNRKNKPLFVLVGGMSALAIVMGIGRFAYTPILPYLQDFVHLSSGTAGYLASSNYLGYLLGALFAGIFRWKGGKTFPLRIFLALNILTTVAMGLTDHLPLWFILRFLSGLSSGVVFVLASSLTLDVLARAGKPVWAGSFYSGVGIGIFFTGLLVPWLNHYFGWQGTWIGVGLLSFFLSPFTIGWLREDLSPQREGPPPDRLSTSLPGKNKILPWLVAAYGCEGMGYIVSGTFLVALVREIPSLNHDPALSWVIVGLAAIPSSVLLAQAAAKWGDLNVLQTAYFLQMIGVILPTLLYNSYGALAGSLLFGGTFMGITTLAVSAGRRMASRESSKVIGLLTFVYGVGQMAGPSLAGFFITGTGNYTSSLLFAAVVLGCGMLFLGAGQIKASKEKIAGSGHGSAMRP